MSTGQALPFPTVIGRPYFEESGLGPKFPKIDPAANAKRFIPPSVDATPDSLFFPGVPPDLTIPAPRWLRRTNNREALMFADGACLGNGVANAVAGCGFAFRPETSLDFVKSQVHGLAFGQKFEDDRLKQMNWHSQGTMGFRLENRGPNDTLEEQTSNRAELRAVLGLLEFRTWVGEGIQRLVVATDSTYVVDGATDWIHTWQGNGWRTSKRTPVANKDLWEYLIGLIAKLSDVGLEVVFWKIPRALNTVADGVAKAAAAKPPQNKFSQILGITC